MRAILLGCLLAALPRASYADEVGPQGGPETAPPVEPKKETPGTEEAPPPPRSEAPIIYKAPIRPREIVVDVPGVRSTQTRLILGTLAAATVIVGGIGLYFHVESRDAANEVSRSVFDGETWTQARQDRLEEGERARSRAIVSYTFGGLLLTGTVVALILSEPRSERHVIRPRHAGVAPIPGGAIAGAGWSF
jgi:hypothetical protein